jgi:hypothetical protein
MIFQTDQSGTALFNRKDVFCFGCTHGAKDLCMLSNVVVGPFICICRGSPLVKIDETGWKVNGFGHWLHVFVTELAMLYRIDRRRGHEVPAEILGLDYDGTMVHDGLASYGQFLDAIPSAV